LFDCRKVKNNQSCEEFMRSSSVFSILLAGVLLALVSCNTDPNVAKKRYLEGGNRYFDRGKFKEARIMYRRAKDKDARYGPAYYHLGLADEKLKMWGEAVQSFRRAIELLPPDQPDHWSSVVKLSEIYLALAHNNKEYMDDVQDYCAQLLKHDPNSFDGHRLSGDLAFSRAGDAFRVAQKEGGQKLLDQALAEYRRANEIKSGDRGVMMQLARTLSGKGQFAEAEQIYRQVLAMDKTYLSPYGELYNLYMFQGKRDEGEQILKLGFQNNPQQYGFLTRLALHYFTENRREDMIKVLQQIKSHAKEYDRAYLDTGDFYLRLADGDAAIKEYREGMAKDSRRKATYQKRIVEVLMRQGKRAEAAEVNQQILADNPNDSDARGLAATFLLDKGDVSKALVELQAVVTRDPANPVSHYNLGRAYAAHGDYELARQQLQKAIDLRPDYILARLAMAQLQVALGQYDAALKTARDVLRIDSTNINARLIESAALMGQKKFGDSHDLLEEMLKANPSSPDVLYQLGVVDLAQSKFKEAEDTFSRAYQLNPSNSRGLMGLVETYMAQNKPDDALALLSAESAKAPNRMDLVLALGNTSVRAGKYDQAISYFQRVLNSLPASSRQRGDIYLRIGETYRQKGDLANSIVALQQARQVLPDNLVVLSTLGLVLDTAGQWDQAKQVYQTIVRLDPNNGVILNNLAFLLAEHGGDLDDALSKAQRAKQLLPNLAEVSDTLGWIYLKKNLSDEAIDIFKDLVQKVPTEATYRYHLGMAFYQKGDKPRALQELENALKYNPKQGERDKIEQLIAKLG
jgi:tetratricopeptide (TPR) repeat protein